MGESRLPGAQGCLTINGVTPGRTPGCLGRNDAADPNCVAICGDTPGSVGSNDLACSIANLPTKLTLTDATSNPQLTLLPTYWLVLDGFAVDVSELTRAHRDTLDEFAKRLLSTLSGAPETLIFVTGFTDAPGTEEHNLKLGAQRAAAAVAYLVTKGVPAAAMTVDTMGAKGQRIATRKLDAGNRRVEIDVFERKWSATLLTHKLTPPQMPSASAFDLDYHPHPPTTEEEIDRLLKQEVPKQKPRPDVSVAKVFGDLGRKVAEKLGLPKFAQDAVAGLAEGLPTKGAQLMFDQLKGDSHLDNSQKEVAHKIIEAIMKLNWANPQPKIPGAPAP